MADNQWALEGLGKGDPTSKSMKKIREHCFSNGSSSTSSRRITGSPREIPKAKSPAEHVTKYSSAPMDVPDWSRLTGNKGAKAEDPQNDDVTDDDGNDGEMIPPHDYIARRVARTKILSYSMCEGNGRTLKGRDLRRVRNDVLTKTGFLE